MAHFKVKRGYNIPLAGAPERVLVKGTRPKQAAVQPADFRNFRPQVEVGPGAAVKVGSVLFVDKKHPEIRFLSPVAGTVNEVVRGERRRIMRVVVDAASGDDYEEFPKYSDDEIKRLNREKVQSALLQGGLWPAIRQRPYSNIAALEATPKAIFISGMETAPLAADPNFYMQGLKADFQSGIYALQHLTEGKIHLSVAPDQQDSFDGVDGVERHTFAGPHPAGNVSVQVYHIDRLRAGEIIWYISPFDVARIGQLLKNGRYPNETIVAVAGPELEKRQYVKTISGASMASILPEKLDDDEQRVLSGTVLAGTNASLEGFIGFYDHTVTVIPEVQKRRLLGWLSPGFSLASYGGTFFSSLFRNKKFVQNTDINGDERAFVSTGNYEKVMPMDILPVHLAKAVLVEDIELMEKLGILEVAPEDFALCTYICPSKIEFGEIIEHGLTLIEKEG